jgi:hypothetical protein
MTRIVVDIDKDGNALCPARAEESGLTSFVSWAALAQILAKANVGSLREGECFKQLRADEHGITVRIGAKT